MKYFRVEMNDEIHKRLKTAATLSEKTMQEYMHEAIKEKMEREKALFNFQFDRKEKKISGR